jgi:hypothetical protein
MISVKFLLPQKALPIHLDTLLRKRRIRCTQPLPWQDQRRVLEQESN